MYPVTYRLAIATRSSLLQSPITYNVFDVVCYQSSYNWNILFAIITRLNDHISRQKSWVRLVSSRDIYASSLKGNVICHVTVEVYLARGAEKARAGTALSCEKARRQLGEKRRPAWMPQGKRLHRLKCHLFFLCRRLSCRLKCHLFFLCRRLSCSTCSSCKSWHTTLH